MTEPRDQALAALYQIDQLGSPETSGLPDLSARAQRLVAGVVEHIESLDASIETVSEHWRVDRMPVLDRAVLRLALYELRYEKETPTAVVIAEAVRLAKTYSTEKSGAFVNGVLGSLARTERTDEQPSEDTT